VRSDILFGAGALVVVAGLLGVGTSCTDETVYVTDTVPIAIRPGPDVESGFLGYYDAGDGQTNCGNCHVDHQRRWAMTAHASAYDAPGSTGHDQPSCYGCHTVNENGNSFAAEGTAGGWNAVEDEAYHDVQCESCHGPGLDHAEVPDVAAPPLAQLAIFDDAGDPSATTCAACHSGAHHPFVEEWAQSRHAHAVESPATRDGCNGCHEGRGVLRAWGMDANYLEAGDVVTADNTIGITCAVCHNPHGSSNEHQLRWPLETLDPEQNLCMKCHLRRTVPAGGSSRGNTPHAPQGAVLLGVAGYQNPAYLDTLLLQAAAASSHASPTRNPKICAGCHLFPFQTTDSDGNAFSVTGHLFRPIPCYGPDQLPTDTITDCAYTVAERSFKACAQSGCHATENEAALFLSLVRQRSNQLSATLWKDLNGNRTIDPFPTDDGYLAKIKANTTDLNPSDAVVSAADGAEFNLRLVGEDDAGFLYDNGDKSHTAHNPFIAEALLRASIEELVDVYTGQPWFPSLPPAIQQILNGPLGVSGKFPPR